MVRKLEKKNLEVLETQIEEELDAKLEHEKMVNKYYAVFAFLWSFVVGGMYAWLFTWKAIGMSHLLFFFFFEFTAILPVLILEKNEGAKRISFWLTISVFLSVLSVSFLYRLNVGWGTLAFITLPVVNAIFLSATFFPDTLKHLGILSIVTLPFKIFIAWFVDLFNLFKNIDFGIIKSSRAKSIIGRMLFGSFMGLLALCIFVPLLSMADQVFAQFVSDFFKNAFGDWFNSFDASLSTIGKFIVGLGVAGYSSVFLFSLWNKNSYLKEMMDGNVKHPIDEAKRDWDVISASTFMFILNIVFVLFVVVQFKYFFGGTENILGLNANYQYADYARKGFSELVTVAILVYFISVLLSSKVYTANLLQKLVFRINFVIMVISTLIITYAAYARLDLLQNTYGYTETRLLGLFIMIVIAIVYIFLLISALLKSPWKFINYTAVIILFCSYAILILSPSDYIVVQLNANRYKNTQKIDLPYLFSLQDEAVPVLIGLAKDESVNYNIRTEVMANLESKWDRIRSERKDWQSYNFVDQYNKDKLAEAFGKNGSYEYRKKSEDQLKLLLNDYVQAIKKENYDEAYGLYWSKNSKMLDLSTLKLIDITSYEVTSVPEYKDWTIINSDSDGIGNSYVGSIGYPYWDGMNVNLKLNYMLRSGVGPYATNKRYCRHEALTLVLEDGQWKIINASQLTLGNFKDQGTNRANYYQNADLFHLTSSDYSGCGQDGL